MNRCLFLHSLFFLVHCQHDTCICEERLYSVFCFDRLQVKARQQQHFQSHHQPFSSLSPPTIIINTTSSFFFFFRVLCLPCWLFLLLFFFPLSEPLLSLFDCPRILVSSHGISSHLISSFQSICFCCPLSFPLIQNKHGHHLLVALLLQLLLFTFLLIFFFIPTTTQQQEHEKEKKRERNEREKEERANLLVVVGVLLT